MQGRKPKPTKLKIVAGNPGHRPLNKDEPEPVAYLASAPEWFDELQAQYWNDAIASAPAGLLGTMDRELLVVWVCASVMHRRAMVAQTEIDEGKAAPMLTKTPGGMPVQSPYVGIINRQAAVMLKAASEMGFTPSSRTRIKVGGDAVGGNPFDRF
jgi:P27 family predicted phage terminase small subunit